MNDCGDHCITCSDEGIPMHVEIALVEPVEPGDRLLVHAGVALAGLGS